MRDRTLSYGFALIGVLLLPAIWRVTEEAVASQDSLSILGMSLYFLPPVGYGLACIYTFARRGTLPLQTSDDSSTMAPTRVRLLGAAGHFIAISFAWIGFVAIGSLMCSGSDWSL